MKNEKKYKSRVHEDLAKPRIGLAMIFFIIIIIIFTSLEYSFAEYFRKEFVMKDYDAFFVAGRMFWEGRLEDAYFAKKLIVAQEEIVGAKSFMPWTYPPHFNMVTGLLALLPAWLGYTTFISLSFFFYLAMLRMIAPSHYLIVLIFTYPAAIICARTGQNGFLVAGIFCFFILNIDYSKIRAGAALMVASIKPHFLLPLYLLSVVDRRWHICLLGISGTISLLLVSSFIFGFGIWPAFKNSTIEASGFLHEGLYPLFRMTSLYATLHTFGFSPSVALMAQMILALTAIGIAFYSKIKNWPRHQTMSIFVMSSLFVSPYAYDYDLQIFGVALALLMPDLWEKASGKQILVLLAGCWFSASSLIIVLIDEMSKLELHGKYPAINFLFLISVCFYIIFIVRSSKRAY